MWCRWWATSLSATDSRRPETSETAARIRAPAHGLPLSRYELLHVQWLLPLPICARRAGLQEPRAQFRGRSDSPGNGMLAQLIASIYDDHSSISEQAGILDRLDFSLAEEHIGTGLDNATPAMRPVMDALVAEAESAKANQPSTKRASIPKACPTAPHRRRPLPFVSSATTAAPAPRQGRNPPLLKDAPPSRRKETVMTCSASGWATTARSGRSPTPVHAGPRHQPTRGVVRPVPDPRDQRRVCIRAGTARRAGSSKSRPACLARRPTRPVRRSRHPAPTVRRLRAGQLGPDAVHRRHRRWRCGTRGCRTQVPQNYVPLAS